MDKIKKNKKTIKKIVTRVEVGRKRKKMVENRKVDIKKNIKQNRLVREELERRMQRGGLRVKRRGYTLVRSYEDLRHGSL